MSRILRWFIVATLFAGPAWPADSSLAAGTAAAPKKRILWQSREQFVAMEPQDGSGTDAAQENSHPAPLTADQLTVLLAAIRFKPEGSAAAAPLFTGSALEALTPHLALGLEQSAPNQDLTFAVFGLHTAMLGLAKEPRVTTGRLFVKEGRLNLIIGLAQRDVHEREDRRLYPFTPGSRVATATGTWTLQPTADLSGATLIRRDWISLPTNWKPAVASPATAAPQTPRAAATAHPAERLTTLKELLEKGLITEDEYRNKRREILQEL